MTDLSFKQIIAINAGDLKKAGAVLLPFALNFCFALSSFADSKKIGFANACLKLFQPDKPKSADAPKNIAELGLAVTQGLTLTPEQKAFWEIYLNNFFEKPSNTRENITKVHDLINQYPGLSKPSFREQELSLKVKRYLVSKELSSFIQSFTKSNGKRRLVFFHIEEHGLFWLRVLNPSRAEESSSQRGKRELEPELKAKLVDIFGGEESLKNIRESKRLEEDRILNVYKKLEEERNKLLLKNEDISFISKAMLDLIHTAGFFNKDWTNQMKDKDPVVVIRSVARFFEYREHLSLELGFKSFSDLKHSLGLSRIEKEFYDKEELLKRLEFLEEQIKGSESFIEDQEVVYRVRALRLQESPFRGCLGGSDCSSHTYFEKGLDPNYIYFTKTGLEDSKSSGQVTVVLGTAKAEYGSKKKIAFIDKIQNFSKEELIPFLSAVRKSVQEEGYILALPLNVGDHNGLSNTIELENYVSESILPALLRNNEEERLKNEVQQRPFSLPAFIFKLKELKNKPQQWLKKRQEMLENEAQQKLKVLRNFTPLPHDYNNFRIGYSRAEQGLDMIEFTLKPGDNVQIIPGAKYEDYSVEGLNKKDFIAELSSLRESKNREDLSIYVDSILALNKWQDFKKLLGEPEKILRKMLEETDFFKLRKKILYILISEFEIGLSDFLYMFERFFTEAEKNSLRSEISNWKNSSDLGKKEFYKLLRIAFPVRPQLSYFKNLFKKDEEIVSYDLEFVLRKGKKHLEKSRKKNQEEYEGIVLDLLETTKWDDIKDNYNFLVASVDYIKIMAALIENGADVKALRTAVNTALQNAAMNGHEETVKVLIRAGADVMAVNRFGNTALHIATERGLTEIVETLIKNGANVKAVNQHEETALHVAAEEGHTKIVEVLIRAGADVDAENKYGKTALYVAAKKGHTKIVEALIRVGADVDAENKYGKQLCMLPLRRVIQK